MKIAFKNVNFVSDTGTLKGDFFLDEGEPVEIMPYPDEEIDCSGKYLLPGLVDAHVHFREPGQSEKEDWEHAGAGAVVGGICAVLDMPNNTPHIVSAEALEAKRDLISGRSYVNYGFHFGVGDNFEELSSVEGVKSFKVYMGRSTGDMLLEEKFLRKVFEIAKDRDLPVVVHAEDEERIRMRAARFEDDDSFKNNDPRVHAYIRDSECARLAVSKAVKLREEVGNKLHIAHVSTKEEIDILRKHKCDELSCEVAPHHLYFSIEDFVDNRFKVNPPLRSEEDIRVLWEAVRDGTVDLIATDHAPHLLSEKEAAGAEAPAGLPGNEFLLPLMLNEVNEKMLDFEDVIRLLHTRPIEIFGLDMSGGNFVLVDMDLEKEINREMVLSKCAWSPYEGYKLKGWPVMTLVNGEIVAREGRVAGKKNGRELV